MNDESGAERHPSLERRTLRYGCAYSGCGVPMRDDRLDIALKFCTLRYTSLPFDKLRTLLRMQNFRAAVSYLERSDYLGDEYESFG
jgi:hypothetical protein